MKNLVLSLLSLVLYSTFGASSTGVSAAAIPEVPNVSNPTKPMLSPLQIRQVNSLLRARNAAVTTTGELVEISATEVVVPTVKYGVYLPNEEVYIKPVPESGIVAKYGVNIPPQFIKNPEPVIIGPSESVNMKYGVNLPEVHVNRSNVVLPEVEHNVLQKPVPVNVNLPLVNQGQAVERQGHSSISGRSGVIRMPEIPVDFGIPDDK